MILIKINEQSHKINYQPRKKTDLGAQKIIQTLKQYPLALLAVGTGGGKTFMTIHAIAQIDPHAHIFIVTTKKQIDENAWGASIDSYNQNVKGSHLTYSAYNYEALDSKKQQPGIIKIIKKHQNQNMYFIADEAHRIKNPGSNAFKHVQKFSHLPNCRKLICLSATPITESLLDATSYLILKGDYKNKTAFNKAHVTRYDAYHSPMIKDWHGVIRNDWLKDPDQIIEQINQIQIQIDTKSLLPTVKFKELRFKFDPATQKAYNHIKKDYLDGVYDSIASANADQRKFIADHDQKRQQALSTIINDPKRPQGPILIFYQYNSELDSLRRNLKHNHPDYTLLEINGHQSYDTSKIPPTKSLILCQYLAAGEALNAQWSHLTVFYAPTYSWKNFKQACGRNVRAYQGGTTYQIRFVVLKTINEHYWYDLIDNKKKFSQELEHQYLLKTD